jgi:tartronate-semialdehyde synthase
MAMTVLEPAQVPGAFQQAFHLMRSGRPSLVLIDLPFDGHMAEIDFDPDTYARTAVEVGTLVDARALVAFTVTGVTARRLARYRSPIPLRLSRQNRLPSAS